MCCVHVNASQNIYKHSARSNMKEVTSEGLAEVLRNFEWILEKVRAMAELPAQAERARVVCILGSGFGADLEVARAVQRTLERFHIQCVVRVASAHKSTADVLQAIADYECTHESCTSILHASVFLICNQQPAPLCLSPNFNMLFNFFVYKLVRVYE